MLPWVRLAIAAAALAATFAGGAGVGWRWRDRDALAADLERERAEAKGAQRRGETALRAAQQYEVDREAIRARLRASDARVAAALAQPVPSCSALAVGDVVLPPGILDRVRRAAGELQAAADAAESRPAVPGRFTDP